ncbi:MAG: hypothetical protein IKN38_07215 [Clostridia bacterium]|nr:hypothetical protein [Clostridia bacterium]
MKNKVTFSVKLDAETYKKLALVAEKEGKNVNNHILHLARTNIAYYERVHGRIKPSDLDAVALPDDGADNSTD